MAPEPAAVLEVRDLGRSYGRFRRVPAVRGVSFAVRRGEIFGLIGPDGAGKTSIIQTLAGVLRPHAGSASVNGLDVVSHAEVVKARVGYMPQGLGSNLYDSLSVRENIEFFRDLRRLPEEEYQRNRAELLAATRLEPFLDRRVEHLSGGMRQKLALICTLIHLPDVLLLDEPTTGVDPISRQEFWQIIRRVVDERSTTVLVSTSYMDEAERCHRIALVHGGQIIAEGQPADVAQRGSLEDVFLRIPGGEESSGPAVRFERVAPRSSGAAIDCRLVTRRFGAFTAVDAVDLSVAAGEVFGLLGPNGAGKTTLIKMMCGLIEPSSGSIAVGGIDVRTNREQVWRAIGYMSQRFSLYQDLSVRQNLRFYADLYDVQAGQCAALAARLGLEPFMRRLTRDLPAGVRQRVSLLCAVLHNPPIVFLDEPTSGVDPRARRVFWELIRSLSRDAGVTVVVSTHYLTESAHCDRLGLMDQARLVAVGSPAELTRQSEQRSGRLLSLDCDDPARAYRAVRQAREAAIYGNRIHVRTFDPGGDAAALAELVARAGAGGCRIEPVPLSMDETFIDFIRTAEAAHA
jgi:ABC-type multidrug transport system ATPase subunit